MAQIPDTIVLRRDRDLGPRRNDIWIRRGLFALLCVVPVLALLNLFGQGPDTSTGTAAAATLSVVAPRTSAAWARFFFAAIRKRAW